MNDPYVTTFLEKNTECCDVSGIYRLRPERRCPWLQRILFWILGKLGAHDVKVTSTMSEVLIHSDKLFRFLDSYVNEVYRRTGEPPKRVIMGWRTLRYFVESSEYREMMSFCQTLDLTSLNTNPPGQYERAFYRGYKIFTFPWFEEGVIMLPNDL